MTVLYADGTMGHNRWDKEVVALAFPSPICSFGLGGGRYCILDLKDLPYEATLENLRRQGKTFPDVIDWLGLNIAKASKTIAMLQEDGYDADPILERVYKAFQVNVSGKFEPVCAREVLIDLARRQIATDESVAAIQRACRYWYS